MKARYVLILAILATAPWAWAGEFQSHDSILQAAKVFLEGRTAGMAQPPQIEMGYLDKRLHMPACDTPLQGFLPAGGRMVGNVTVGVRCGGPKPWSLYVQAKARLISAVVVSNHPISRGSRIGASDVSLEERDVGRIVGGYLTDLTPVVGQVANRSVRAGMVLNRTMMEAAVMIRRGEHVTITARSGGLVVRQEGEALEDGALGEVIRVRNRSSKRTIEGRISGAGAVEVNM